MPEESIADSKSSGKADGNINIKHAVNSLSNGKDVAISTQKSEGKMIRKAKVTSTLRLSLSLSLSLSPFPSPKPEPNARPSRSIGMPSESRPSLTRTARTTHLKVDMGLDSEDLSDSFNAEDEEISPFKMLREVCHYVGSVRSDNVFAPRQRAPSLTCKTKLEMAPWCFVSLNATPPCQVCQTRQNLQNHAIAAVHLKEGLHDHFKGRLSPAHANAHVCTDRCLLWKRGNKSS